MADDKYKILGDRIYAHVGGIQNVAKLIHCMTRLRISIRDAAQVDLAGLEQIQGVLGVAQEDTLQVILGPGVVNKVATAMVREVGVELGADFPTGSKHAADKYAVTAKAALVKAGNKANLKQTWWRRGLQHISAIFIPLIPAFVGAGLISGIAGVMGNMEVAGDLSNNWATMITTLKVINSGLFTYLNIFVGINAAQEFGATPGLGGIIAGLIYLPGVAGASVLPNTFTGQPLVPGSGGVLGALFAVWVLAFVEKFLHQHVPDALDIIVTPFLTLLIIGLFTIFLIMPAAGWVSSSLVGLINWVLSVGGAFAGFILGSLFLPMVMLGLHQVLTPIHLEMIKHTGSTPLLPILAMAGAGQVGAALALWVRCRKNKQLTRLIKGALPVGILGVGEPLIYGVSLPLGQPFITACIGGGIGGAVIGAIGNVGATSIGPSGVALIPLITNGHWLEYIIGLLAAYAGGFVLTFFLGVPRDAMRARRVDGTPLPATATEAAPDLDAVMQQPATPRARTELLAPVTGRKMQLADVPDTTFARQLMGAGFAIVPETDSVVAPAAGTITSIASTKHAFMLKTDTGLELLVHLGIDTVELNGTPFTYFVQVGAHVSAGQQVGLMDVAAIVEAGKDPVVVTIVTNMSSVARISPYALGAVASGAMVINVVNK
ncbi:glucose PTS transporter subunit IIA [Lacticaseibacillus zhaodongensis]|uniref:glucose PTS transporter subunit IIA n=1 Tax=Lacticaseibacillus zhaodongensis TaxID=2668065 RepID=UPI0012D3012A|nr:glucose PTS transporter subunit IIA [Lacticaseibacillus zhaodongensis]